jgi:hypothetical protein
VWDAKASIDEVPLQLRRTESNEFFTGIDRPLESQYNYYTDSLALQPGREYRLVVEQGGKRVVATTRMPGEFALRSVNGRAAGTSVPRGEPLVLAWSRSEGAALYAVTVVGDAGSSAFSLSGPAPLLTSDTTASLAFTAGSSIVPVTIEIRAMDSNQYRASAHRDTRAGIEGGYGSFGSVNAKRYRLTLQVGQ